MWTQRVRSLKFQFVTRSGGEAGPKGQTGRGVNRHQLTSSSSSFKEESEEEEEEEEEEKEEEEEEEEEGKEEDGHKSACPLLQHGRVYSALENQPQGPRYLALKKTSLSTPRWGKHLNGTFALSGGVPYKKRTIGQRVHKASKETRVIINYSWLLYSSVLPSSCLYSHLTRFSIFLFFHFFFFF